jgi:dienelactone hydrolase
MPVRARLRPYLFIGALVAASLTAPAMLAAQGIESVARHTLTYKSEGRSVRLEEFRPLGDSLAAPAVILLHGASGIHHGSLIYGQARALAESGIVAYVLHYFDGMTGGAKARPSKFPIRDQIIEDALAFISQLPQVDEKRIGLFGFSLGAFHALGLAAKDSRLAAVAAVGGGMPNQIPREEIEAMPPTLIVHGARDKVVPVKRAREVASIMEDLGADFDIVIWKGQPHMLKGSALDDTLQKVVSFFEQHFSRTGLTAATPVNAANLPDPEKLAPL